MIVVGYSEQPLVLKNENTNEDTKGFIGSLTNQTIYGLRTKNEKAKVATYNEVFIIFGNAEIRIKKESDKIYSNLGTNHRFFNTPKEVRTPEILFGSEER